MLNDNKKKHSQKAIYYMIPLINILEMTKVTDNSLVVAWAGNKGRGLWLQRLIYLFCVLTVSHIFVNE